MRAAPTPRSAATQRLADAQARARRMKAHHEVSSLRLLARVEDDLRRRSRAVVERER